MADRRPGHLDQNGLQELVAVPALAGVALPSGLVGAGEGPAQDASCAASEKKSRRDGPISEMTGLLASIIARPDSVAIDEATESSLIPPPWSEPPSRAIPDTRCPGCPVHRDPERQVDGPVGDLASRILTWIALMKASADWERVLLAGWFRGRGG